MKIGNARVLDTVIGTAVILLVVFLFMKSNFKITDPEYKYYNIDASFNNIDGLCKGGDIKLSGVSIGHVSNIYLNQSNYMAMVQMAIQKEYKVPVDSSFNIVSASLLGGKHIMVEPGIEDVYLKSGDSISNTRSSVNLESMLGRFLFNK